MSQSSQRRPPSRLSWPSASASAIGKAPPTTDTKPGSRKRPRLSNIHNRTSAENSTAMWVDRFPPNSSSDLCVAPKRVSEIRTWMEEAVELKQNKLLVLVGSPGVGKSATVRVLAKELKLDVLCWNESYVSRGDDSFRNDLLSIEHSSAIDSFREFLQQTGTGFSSLELSKNKGSASTSNRKSIILLEELPNLHGSDAVQRFRGIMSQHLHRSQVPTVLIFSDVSEGKHKPDDLEQLVDPADLYSSFTCIRQMHPVTKSKMKKVMDGIAKVLKCKITPTMLEELHLQSGGDMRHAIMNLQLYSTGLKTVDASSQLQNNRDVKLSTFHALGKLLYAKREEKNGRSVLMFEPDETIERSDLGMGASLRFLEYHSADFFTDSIELSNAFDLYSDAAVLLDHPDRHRADTSFMDAYAASIAGRTVAHTNTKPTANKFRQFSTPKVFDVLRKRRENERLLGQLGRRLSISHLSLSNSVGCTSTFITETLPHMRNIVPNDVNPQVDNLHSIVGLHKSEKNAMQKEIDKGLEEQAAILQMDDIVDSDSDADGGARQPVSNGTNKYASNQTVAAASQASGSGPVCDESGLDRKPKRRQPPAVPIPSFDTSPSDAEIIVID